MQNLDYEIGIFANRNHLYHLSTSTPTESRVPSSTRRSGLPRLTSHLSSVLSAHPNQLDQDKFSKEPTRSPLSRFQPLALKRVFSTQRDQSLKETSPISDEPSINCAPKVSPSCTSWIPSFSSKPQEKNWQAIDEEDKQFQEYWQDDSSTFSKQLAKITSGADEEYWGYCNPCLSGPRPAWPADGSHAGTDNRKLTKDCIGRRVLIGGKEGGILRYFGRTAFSSGQWCGIELEKPVGKNDGSVDGVIYFSCSPGHGIFAPDHKVSLLKYTESEVPMKRVKYGSNGNKTIYRLSAGSSSSSSSGMSEESKKSSGASSATYTIVGRADNSLPSTPEEHKALRLSKKNSLCFDELDSDLVSPGEGTYEDSSLGILSPDQMPDFTGSASMERSPSDDEIAALEDEICEEIGAVGGSDSMNRWDSEGSISGVEEELLQRDISAIIRELKRKETDNSSASSSPSVPNTIVEENIVCEQAFVCDESVRSKTPLTSIPKDKFVKFLNEDHFVKQERKVEIPVVKQLDQLKQQSYVKIIKKDSDSEVSEWQNESTPDMTMSAASLDQGYQGDGEFDVPSEAGSATASSPIEDSRLFGANSDIEQMVVDSHSSAITDAEVSIADEEAELESGIMPRDRAARIIDGKLYHNHRELVALRQVEGRQHDAHTSEMDSSGFYSDLDPRDEDSTRLEAPSLQPLRESKLDGDLHDSVLEDITNEDDEMLEYASVTKGDPDNSDSHSAPQTSSSEKQQTSNEESSLNEEEEKSSASTIRSESKDISSSEHNASVPSDSSTATNLESNNKQNLPQENETKLTEKEELDENLVLDSSKSASKQESFESDDYAKSEQEGVSAHTQKPRNYDKPWRSKPPTPRKVDKPKPVLQPPPPMPKKNVQSKLKALLEASAEVSAEERKPRQPPKKGRWDDVMSRIEEGKKEEKDRPKVKEVKSRLMDALKAPQHVSPQVERIRQERKERRERRERQVAASAVTRRNGDRKRSVASNWTSRAPSLDSLGPNAPVDSRSSTPDMSLHSTSSNLKRNNDTPRSFSPCPSDTSITSNQSQVSILKRHTPRQPIGIKQLTRPNTKQITSVSTSCGTPTPVGGRMGVRGGRIPPSSRLNVNANGEDKKKKLQEFPCAASSPASRRKIDSSKAPQTTKGSTRTIRKTSDPVKILRSATPNVGSKARSSVNQSSEQLKKLEADLSSRKKDLKTAEEEASKATLGVEALTVLVHYLVKEYDAFSTPQLKCEIEKLTNQINNVQLNLDETTATARRLEDEAVEKSQEYHNEIGKLQDEHSTKLASIAEEHRLEIEQTKEKHLLELREEKDQKQIQREQLIQAHKDELERIDNDWRLQVENQHERHLQSLKQLNTCHTQQIKDAEAAWEAKEKELHEANAKLLKEQNTLKAQAKKLEETLLSDKDHRLQAAKGVCTSLQNEVESLKTVVEMRNDEVHKLRDQLADRERLIDDLETARERLRSLQAKTEDLNAQMEQKSNFERQMLADQHMMSESLQRETSTNKRLLLENEELQWKLRQREALMAADNLPTSTLDLVTRCSPLPQKEDRGSKSGDSSPQVTPRSQRLASKSHLFKNEHEKRWTQSFGNIPEEAKKLLRKSELQDYDELGAESPPASPRVKSVIEKSNSVSFILDLNDTFPEEPFLGIQSSPLLRKPRTPTPNRKPIQKSFSNAAIERSNSSSRTKNGRGDVLSQNFMTKSLSIKKVQKNNEAENRMCKSVEDSKGLFTNGQNHYSNHNNRGHTTSESSDDVERVSPTGMAWSVPINNMQKRFDVNLKHIPNRFQILPSTPRLLQQPDEDEYEEIENEFVEVMTLEGGEDLNSAPLTTLFAQTPSTSVSLSDSDISQCGSRGDLSSDDEDCTDDDEEGTQIVALPKDSLLPQEGAGEAMIFPDAFGFGEGNKKSLTKENISKSQVSSTISSDSEEPNHQQLNGDESGLNTSWSEEADCDLTSSSEMQEL